MNLFDLMAVIRLDKSEYTQGLADAETEAAGFKSKLGSVFGTVGKVGAAALGTIATGTAAATTAMIAGTKQAAAYGDNIDKMSQKLGLSAESYQKWDYVLGQAGASIDSMQTGLKTLTNKLDDAKNGSADAQKMFANLGLSLEDLNSMSREDIFEQVIYGFQGMADSTERAALANDLFGRSGQELTPLFNAATEETMGLMQAAEDLGFVMSDEAVKSSAEFQDSLDTLQRTVGGLKRGIVGDLMPSLTAVMDGLTEIFSGNNEEGIGMVTTGIQKMVDDISAKIPDIMAVGSEIVTSLLTAITDNLPTLLKAGADAVLTITTGLIENLPTIIASGLDVIVSLADGIAESLPELIPTVVDVVLQIVTTLLNNSDKLVNAALKLIIALGKGLIQAIPQLVRNIPQIISSIVKALLDGVAQIRDVGSQLLTGLWDGINDKVAWLKGKVAGVVDKIKGWFTGKSGFDEHSPSRWAADVFEKLMEGSVEGLEAGEHGLLSTVSGVVESVQDAFAPSANMSVTGRNRSNVTQIQEKENSQPISIQLTLDSVTLAQLLVDPLRRVQQFNGGSYISMGGSAV